jgi:drug/metabolite transporter (DMT)-like permease
MSDGQLVSASGTLDSTDKQRQIAILALLAVTLVWGATFIWMKQALDALDTEKAALGTNGVVATLVFARFAIAAIMMLLFFKKARTSLGDKQIWQDGFILGILMFIAYLSQMIGLDDIDPSVSAFLTSLYVVFTALISSIYNLRLPTKIMILGVGLATFGAGFIQGPPHLTWGVAEFITVFCALLFALHILFTQHITTRRDPIAVSTTSFIVVTLCSAITVFFLGDGTNMEQWNLIFSDGVLVPVLLLGVGGSFFCLLFLNIYQRYLHPIQAAIIYALEPVWATIYGLHLDMVDWSIWILIGGGALFIGNIIVELLSNEESPQLSEE